MALLEEGGYSLSCAVLNCFELCSEMPMWNVSVAGVGLWHVFCRWYRYLRMMSLSILHVRNVVGLGATCPCMDCLNVCVSVVGHSLMMLIWGSFQIIKVEGSLRARLVERGVL